MKKIKKIIYIISFSILLVILFISLAIIIKSFLFKDKIPGFMGYKPFVVLSTSMENEIQSGDLIIVKEEDITKLQKNDVIAYKTGGYVLAHRIIEVLNTKDGLINFRTKGDNNIVADLGLVTEKQIEGKYIHKISKLGTFVIFLQSPRGMLISISIPLVLIILIQCSENKKNRKNEDNIQKKAKDKRKK